MSRKKCCTGILTSRRGLVLPAPLQTQGRCGLWEDPFAAEVYICITSHGVMWICVCGLLGRHAVAVSVPSSWDLVHTSIRSLPSTHGLKPEALR
jgi:hypothetical protein